ncbi:SOS response-associated peptidase [Cognatiyoonia sp. IB215182]|uniref:SOS response-associated peptidase n=1 Tax=Cognatiyoonia sp. IB215182 TaxID=3097353 RepID=UPI002A0D52C1|nr:SOS response-associated peptidase family protein [Cognatiyoonia sp. IB215182]MDX8354322.1 SOS response-associated peptidase family protein [Cognatiyoonia sp. IB215182]
MCNLYSMTTAQAAMRAVFPKLLDETGNLASGDIYPDNPAPVILRRNGDLVMKKMRWGMPTPPKYLEGKNHDRGVTNVRNTSSQHWRRWMGPQSRCVVPFNAFSEFQRGHGLRWFALSTERPMAFFAGIWTNWTSVRKVKEGEVTTDIFAFLTTDANVVVAPFHPKAMPVILTSTAQVDQWLNLPSQEALRLQRPLDDDNLVLLDD